MKSTILLPLLIFLITASLPLIAQNKDLESVKEEIKSITLKEQNAFKNGDCKTLLSLMDDEITFYANGRPASSKEMIGNFCNRIPRPFEKPSYEKLDVYALTEQSGYVVRTFEYNKDNTTKIKEIVTKTWKKSNEQWKMVHLQSTVKEVPKD